MQGNRQNGKRGEKRSGQFRALQQHRVSLRSLWFQISSQELFAKHLFVLKNGDIEKKTFCSYKAQEISFVNITGSLLLMLS